jgi:hypothetical protein
MRFWVRFPQRSPGQGTDHELVQQRYDRLVAIHYGFYSTIVGVGILLGNLAIGALMSAAHRLNADKIVWIGLILVGLVQDAGCKCGGIPERSYAVKPHDHD